MRNLLRYNTPTLRVSVILVLAVLAGSSCSPARRRAVVILCAGDSLTDSAYPGDLRRLLAKEGISARVLNFGRKGDTSGEYRRFLENQGAALAREHPNFILLELGTNDVRLDGDRTGTPAFVENMRAIIGIFRGFTGRGGGRAVILLGTVPPVPKSEGFPFGPASSERIVREINPALRDLAREEGLALVDNYAVFQASPDLLPAVHPTPEGYRRLARNWRDALLPLLGK